MAMPPHSRAGGSSTAQRGATAAASSSSQTTTIHSPSTRQQHPVLRLRGAMRSPGERSDRRIQWAEDVIDNEGLGRKSSKGMSPFHSPPSLLLHRRLSTCRKHEQGLTIIQSAASTTLQKPQSTIPPTRVPTPHHQTPTATTAPLALPAARGAPTPDTSTTMTTTPERNVTMTGRQRSRGGRTVRMRTRRFQSRKRADRHRWENCLSMKLYERRFV